MHKERLLRLAALLEKDAANAQGVKFDLKTWGVTESGKPDVSCNTTACAAGLACLSGEFKEDGLSYQLIPEFNASFSISPQYDGLSSWMAIVEFFGLESHEAHSIFSEGHYAPDERYGARGELAVATRIREMVDAQG